MKALLIVDTANQTNWPDKLNRWAADVTAEGWTPDRWIPPATATAVDVCTEINRRNPDAVFLLGNIPIPAAGPINPDGHYLRLYPCDFPYATSGAGWNTQNGTFNQLGLPIGAQLTRRVGRCYFEQLSNIDKRVEYGKYLDRVHDARAGVHLYDKRAYLIDHLAYRTDLGGIGTLTQNALTPYFGANLFTGLPDHLPGSGTSDGREYWLELEGHSWLIVSDFSGGLANGTGLFYSGSSDAMELAGPGQPIPIPAQRPDVAYWTCYGSFVGEFTRPDAYVCALLLGSLGVIHMTDVGFAKSPDFTLMGSVPVPEIVRRWQASPSSLAWTYQGDPTLPVLRIPQPGVDTLSSTEYTQLSQQISALQGQVSTLSNAVTALQNGTSAGQQNNGQPVTTAPGSGTAAPSLPALQINCGVTDGLYATSGLVWTNEPAASVTVDLSGVTAPFPAEFYHSGRGGPIAGLLVTGLTPGASVNVRLDFVEPHWTSAGKRLQNVAINGVTVLSAFDTFAAAGAQFKVVSKSFPAIVGADSTVKVSLTATPGSVDQNTYLCAMGI